MREAELEAALVDAGIETNRLRARITHLESVQQQATATTETESASVAGTKDNRWEALRRSGGHRFGLFQPGAEMAVSKSSISAQNQDRESRLKKHYDAKVADLVLKLEQADNRALELESECEKAVESVEEMEKRNRQLNRSAKEAKESEKKSTDELSSTRENYETQLTAMSEHVIEIQEQQSEFDVKLTTLKSHKVMCGRCRNWNSVGWLVDHGLNGMKCQNGDHPSSYNYA